MPPSTRSAVGADAAVLGHRRQQVAGLVADASSAARTISAMPLSRVRPKIAPRASRVPVRRAEPGEGRHEVDAAACRSMPRGERSVSPASAISCSPSRSHCMAAPAMKMLPSSA